MAPWLGSFSELAGMVVIREPRSNRLERIRREFRTSGLLRFLDVLAFRLTTACYSPGVTIDGKRGREQNSVAASRRIPAGAPTFITQNQNSREAERFIADRRGYPRSVPSSCTGNHA